MKKRTLLFSTVICALSILSAAAETVSATDLGEKWPFYGKGVSTVRGELFYMREANDSVGAILISPESYKGDVILRYEIMPMSAASVCVALLGATDAGKAETLTIPEGYDGNMGLWINSMDNYFFAFHNAAHDRPPFLKRFPANERLVMADKNVMRAGAFYSIEAGRKGTKLWFKVDGEKVFETEDPNPLTSGHIAFRIRGIDYEPAACLIRNVTIENDQP
jgi:hypothetical protein